jgi:mono/diheme cytochrome c family protein
MNLASLKCWNALAWIVAIAAFLVLSGCGQGPVNFHLNMIAMTQNNVDESQQQQIADILAGLFGTPDEPFAPGETGLDVDKLRRASGPVHREAIGGAKGLYREHCLHCHGITGDGAGPTAAFLDPYPRDYREGWYKWKSTKREDRPTVDNLMRTLHEGVSGTAMPSFRLLPDLDREALVEYIRYLSIRGELERSLARQVHDGKKGEPLKTDHDSLMAALSPIVASWQSPLEVTVADRPVDKKLEGMQDPAEKEKVKAEVHRRSIAIGRAMFTHEAPGEFKYEPGDGTSPVMIQYVGAACIKCHGPTGLGDGQTTDFDDWTKLVWDPVNWGQRPDKPVLPSLVMPLGALPERHIIPRNLRTGVYRGGRRPLDIYYRIHEGIKGVPMPAAELLTQQDKDAIKKLEAAAAKEFKAKFPDKAEISDDDPEDVLQMKLRAKTEFMAKAVDPEKEKLQAERMWHLIDFVVSLPFEPGGELGADADITDVGHGELHAR